MKKLKIIIQLTWQVRLLFAKSRVAPIRRPTIPRLELCATVLAGQLVPTIRAISAFKNAELFMWTDAEVVLYWLRKKSEELNIFVSNRVIAVLQNTEVSQWRHVKSADNPADLVSRGMSVADIMGSKLWWTGPEFLLENVENWPVWNGKRDSKDIQEIVQSECNKAKAKKIRVLLLTKTNVVGNEFDLLSSISSYGKMIRITAYVLKFCRRCYEPIRKRKKKSLLSLGNEEHIRVADIPKELSRDEKEIALQYWVRGAQQIDFNEEYRALAKGESVAKKSKLWQLSPLLDENEILRVGGRLANTALSRDERQTMILSAKNILATRLINDAHEQLLHGATQQCMQYLRNRFWIIGGRVLVKGIVQNCVKCCRYRKRTTEQMMAHLPEMRINPAPAFHHTGIDFAGPMQIRQSRNVLKKCYIAIFVCMVYKAVHLELVGDMTSASCIAALDRFISLRAGSIAHIYSDNGRNFVGAGRILNEACALWNDKEIARHLALKSIEWHFNVPLAPHHGGLWEAAVKSTKYHLHRIGGSHTFTYEELATLLAKISACLNSRPLVPMTEDSTDLLVLTPGHFVIGHPIIVPLAPSLVHCNVNRLAAWQKIEKLQQEFWMRWSKEYVLEQQRRNKWAKLSKSIEVGNLVFIKDELAPPCYWMMGRVIEVHKGKDNLVRSAKLKTARGEFTRPITKLCLLPFVKSEENGATSEVGLS